MGGAGRRQVTGDRYARILCTYVCIQAEEDSKIVKSRLLSRPAKRRQPGTRR